MTTLLIALFAGILPSFVWLLFWLREDKLHPEPRTRLFFAFLGGMAAVLISLPLERWAQSFNFSLLNLIVIWAIIEELIKYLAVRVTSLKHKFVDEPVDVLIYMITTALGFAALENSLFLFSPVSNGFFLEGLITGNLRFVGAMLLHTATSGLIGIFLALSYYKNEKIKFEYFSVGVILSIILHALFNIFIMSETPDSPGLLAAAFALVWIIIIGLIFFFEKAKRIRPTN